MSTTTAEIPSQTEAVQAFQCTREETINAPAAVVWESILEELGPGMAMPDGTSMKMKLEAFPGGRWFRDLGASAGHLWGHVQVIKPPTLLEITGPLFMSYAATNHVQYRLTAEGESTRLTFSHKSVGLIPEKHRADMQTGWGMFIQAIRDRAVRQHNRTR